jgi:alkylhydroperoxidase family enzyme
VQVTRKPWNSSEEGLEKLRQHGLSDEEIHDAMQVIAYFNYITRLADALGVEPEDFMAGRR